MGHPCCVTLRLILRVLDVGPDPARIERLWGLIFDDYAAMHNIRKHNLPPVASECTLKAKWGVGDMQFAARSANKVFNLMSEVGFIGRCIGSCESASS